jgi:hypothetical protein
MVVGDYWHMREFCCEKFRCTPEPGVVDMQYGYTLASKEAPSPRDGLYV